MTRSSSRARTSERGFVLLAAIVLAVLYFALMELLLIDSARDLKEAQRFRARIVAAALAENGAELAAQSIVLTRNRPIDLSDQQGHMKGEMNRTGNLGEDGAFEITMSGVTTGILGQRATVEVQGRIVECPRCRLVVDYTYHSQ